MTDVIQLKRGWGMAEYAGMVRTMLGIKRNAYALKPGLYQLGSPTDKSPVLVTANYKLTVDILRKSAGPGDFWILVLDTKGVNVWCAAGKGTFGTEELINRLGETELAKRISHKKLIVPQLGAPGIDKAAVKSRSGFSVTFGPVEARHIPEFLNRDWKKTQEMRRKDFPLSERLYIGMTHFSQGIKWTLMIALAFILLDMIWSQSDGYSLQVSLGANLAASSMALFSGSLLTAALLPLLPGRSFSVKGVWISLLMTPLLFILQQPDPGVFHQILTAGKILFLSAFIVFQSLNLTGSSTYTSLSGVRKEMAYAIPLCAVGALAGAVMIVAGGLLL